MPELPEVEVVRRDLEKYFSETPIIEKVEFLRKDLRSPLPRAKAKIFIDSTAVRVIRRAKYLIIQTSLGDLISHLGMTGQWRLSPLPVTKKEIHEHIRLHLKAQHNQRAVLSYHDPRRFGYFDISSDWENHPKIRDLGVEPLDDTIDLEKLFLKFKRAQSSVKSLLMKQEIIVGVGNIYASEALYAAKIRPSRKGSKIMRNEFFELIRCARKILRAAIEAGGSTISDFAHGQGSGMFQQSHLVYDRAGLPCQLCETKIRKLIIAGRSTFFCPKCQK